MKKKDVTAEEVHEMAVKGGIDIPLEKIKKKMEKLDELSSGEEEAKHEDREQQAQ